MRYSSHDIPDLPQAAFQRGPGRSIKPQGGGGKGGSSPKTPDYMALADKDAASNMAMAKYAAQANRVNQVTPYGNLTWTNNRTFDQAGYDRAMQNYQQQLAAAQQRPSSSGSMQLIYPSSGESTAPYYGNGPAFDARAFLESGGVGSSGGSRGSAMPVAPNQQDFYSGGDDWTQTVSLSPEMQAIFDQQMKLSQGLFNSQDAALGRVQQMMASGFDTSNLPGWGKALDANSLPGMGSVYDPTQSTNTATEALLSRINPELDRQAESLRTRLANQGIAQGSAAWNNAMGSFGQQRNDAVTQAGLQGITLGMQQQGQTYGQQTQNRQLAADLQAQQFGQQNALRGGSMQEQAYLRSLPLNELNALRSGSQLEMPQFPGYAQQATTGGTDYTGAAQNSYQAKLAAQNAQNAGSANMMSGLFGLGSMGLSAYGLGLFSDRRLKKNVKLVGTAKNGLNLYAYQYIWGGPSMIGYMADEVEQVAPDAVTTVGGLKMVNYSAV